MSRHLHVHTRASRDATVRVEGKIYWDQINEHVDSLLEGRSPTHSVEWIAQNYKKDVSKVRTNVEWRKNYITKSSR